MARTIKLKNSEVADKAPNVEDLVAGELATNSADGKVYMLKDDGTKPAEVVEVGGLKSIEDDPTPKLGGNLDVSEFTIQSGTKTYPPNSDYLSLDQFGMEVAEKQGDETSVTRVFPGFIQVANSNSGGLTLQGPVVGFSGEGPVQIPAEVRLSTETGSGSTAFDAYGIRSGGSHTLLFENLSTPTEAHHAANKGYVDSKVVGAMVYRGTADASAATPEDATGNATPVAGDMYRITTPGATAFGRALKVGDYVFYNGAAYDIIDSVDPTVTGTENRIAVTGDENVGYTVNIDPAFGMSGLADVDLAGLEDGALLQYNATTQKFEAVTAISGGTY